MVNCSHIQVECDSLAPIRVILCEITILRDELNWLLEVRNHPQPLPPSLSLMFRSCSLQQTRSYTLENFEFHL